MALFVHFTLKIQIFPLIKFPCRFARGPGGRGFRGVKLHTPQAFWCWNGIIWRATFVLKITQPLSVSTLVYFQDFYYDGQGPGAYFYVGTSDRPSNDGFAIANEKGSNSVLGSYNGNNLVLSLPSGKTLRDITWLSVWCDEFEVNFGEVYLPDRLNYPRPQKITAFHGIHEVSSGRVVVVDAQTFLIPRFSYDGQAPDAHFWVGTSQRPGPEGN